VNFTVSERQRPTVRPLGMSMMRAVTLNLPVAPAAPIVALKRSVVRRRLRSTSAVR